ncbi:hypothetical protein PhCBS80983_g04302 [Powellomyces hirtus]|uniref:Uncharacterized protein n=1 Tax=Powellomyces hirtus TaxID=109895 RepID=A0A507E0Q6_9FUNG|nr:hypothetical protein PhCBS80983_g04302 [Powellomyces hirtus]
MDTDYLKHTVGPLLTSALTALLNSGYDASSNYPRGLDPVTFIAEHLLHHDASVHQIAADKKRRTDLVALQESVAAAQHLEKESRRHFEDQIKAKASEILAKEKRQEDEEAAKAASVAAAVAAAAKAAQEAKNSASNANREVKGEGKEGEDVGKSETELRRGVPEAIEEGEEDEKEEGAEAEDEQATPAAAGSTGDLAANPEPAAAEETDAAGADPAPEQQEETAAAEEPGA